MVFSRRIPLLPAVAITTAVAAGLSPTFLILGMQSLAVQATVAVAASGSSIDAFVQTSLDGGATWIDIMNFHFVNTPGSKVSAVTVNIALAAAVTPGDGALTANTILTGLLGDRLRVKYVTVGTYSGGTTLAVNAVASGPVG